MYIAEVGEDIFVLDCGVRYPENELLGIDTVIPDFTYLEENADRVAGSFDSWTCRRHWGAALFLGECSSSGVWNRANDRIGKIDRSKNEATKKFKDFHIIDEHSEIDFGHATISFSGQRIRFLILSESASKPALEISSIQGFQI